MEISNEMWKWIGIGAGLCIPVGVAAVLFVGFLVYRATVRRDFMRSCPIEHVDHHTGIDSKERFCEYLVMPCIVFDWLRLGFRRDKSCEYRTSISLR